MRRRSDPGGVPLADECDQFIPAGDAAFCLRVAVALAGQDADVAAQEVEGDVLDGPARDCGRLLPLLCV